MQFRLPHETLASKGGDLAGAEATWTPLRDPGDPGHPALDLTSPFTVLSLGPTAFTREEVVAFVVSVSCSSWRMGLATTGGDSTGRARTDARCHCHEKSDSRGSLAPGLFPSGRPPPAALLHPTRPGPRLLDQLFRRPGIRRPGDDGSSVRHGGARTVHCVAIWDRCGAAVPPADLLCGLDLDPGASDHPLHRRFALREPPQPRLCPLASAGSRSPPSCSSSR